jgi:hypothetical protein
MAKEQKDMNYYATFIQVAADCPATKALAPPVRGDAKTIPALEYELLTERPYHYTQEELLFAVHLAREGVAPTSEADRRQRWAEFFSKPRACLRCSGLPKKYGWGLHFDQKGKIALVAIESPAYQTFSTAKDLTIVPAMRSKRN